MIFNTVTRYISFFLFASMGLSLVPLQAMDTINLQDHALPNNSVRAKLDGIFQQTHDPKAVTQDGSWKEFKSFHWVVGKLATHSKREFVVKVPRYPAGPIPGTPMIHTPQQNLSRISQTVKAQDFIQRKNLTGMRTEGIWAYPVSGNNADLNNPNITDHDVVIVEEMIRKKSNDEVEMNPMLPAMVQKETLELTQDQINQLYIFAREGKFPDLSPQNFFVDENGKIVPMDLEDLLGHAKAQVNKSNVLVRPLKRYKLNRLEEFSIDFAVGLTGASNKDPEIAVQGNMLLMKSAGKFLLTNYIIEIGLIAGAIAVAKRHRDYARKTDTLINNCRSDIKRSIEIRAEAQKIDADKLSQDNYLELAKKAVKKLAPQEVREELFTAFATLAFATESIQLGKITIFGTEYNSKQEAIDTSLTRIYAIWSSDWSLRSKAMRGMKALYAKANNWIDTYTQSNKPVVVAQAA